jgi:NAD(P)H dehydrogenase (quinone)
MVCAGLPFTEAALGTTRGGGTPYGASHVVVSGSAGELSTEEQQLARALGQRIARLAQALKSLRPAPRG